MKRPTKLCVHCGKSARKWIRDPLAKSQWLCTKSCLVEHLEYHYMGLLHYCAAKPQLLDEARSKPKFTKILGTLAALARNWPEKVLLCVGPNGVSLVDATLINAPTQATWFLAERGKHHAISIPVHVRKSS